MNQVKSRDCLTDFSIKKHLLFRAGDRRFCNGSECGWLFLSKSKVEYFKNRASCQNNLPSVVRITSFVLHFTSVSVSNYTAADTTISVLNIPRCRCIFANSWSWKNTVLSFLFANKHSNGISYLLTSTKLFRSFVVLSEIIA